MFDNRYLTECFTELEKNRERFSNNEDTKTAECKAKCLATANFSPKCVPECVAGN